MKKAQLVEIARQAFYVEESAYKTLHDYLDDIRGHFDDDEVVKDIETSIAEKLHSKAGDTKAVVGEDDIDAVISQLGSVADITGSDEQPKHDIAGRSDDESTGKRQLHRDRDDSIVGGVASGIAHYFSIDPVFIRVAFVIATFFDGAGVFVYFILWLVVPAAETIEQKQAMRGSSATLKDIERSAKEKTDQLRSDHGATAYGLAQGVVGLFSTMLSIVVRFFGAILTIVLGAIAIGVSTFVFSVLFRRDTLWESGVDFTFPGTASHYALIVCAVIGVLAVLALLAQVAVSMLKMKSSFRGALSVWLVGIAIVGFGAAGALLARDGSAIHDAYERSENRVVERIEQPIEAFSSVIVRDQIEVEVVQSNDSRIEYSVSEYMKDKFSYNVVDGQLVLELKDHSDFCFLFCRNHAVDAKLYTGTLSTVQAEDQTEVAVNGFEEPLTIVFKDQSDGRITTQRVGAIRLDDQSTLNLEVDRLVDATIIDTNDQSELFVSCRESARYVQIEQSDQSNYSGTTCPLEDATLKQYDQSHAELNIVNDSLRDVVSEDQASYEVDIRRFYQESQ